MNDDLLKRVLANVRRKAEELSQNKQIRQRPQLDLTRPNLVTNTVKEFGKEYFSGARQQGTAIGESVSSRLQRNRQRNQASSSLDTSAVNLEKARELIQSGNYTGAQRLLGQNQSNIRSARRDIAGSTANLMGEGERLIKEASVGALKTATTAAGSGLVAGAPLKYGTSLALGGALSGGVAKVQGEDFSTGFGRGSARTLRYLPVISVTNPAIRGVIGKAAPGAGIAKEVGARFVGGVGNVIEDEIIAKLEGIDPKLSDRALSFGIGALIASGGTEQDWNNLKNNLKSNVKDDFLKRDIDDIIDTAWKKLQDQPMGMSTKQITTEQLQQEYEKALKAGDTDAQEQLAKQIQQRSTDIATSARPQHQIDLEEAINKGDAKKAKTILSTISDDDPYKGGMQGIVLRLFGGEPEEMAEAVRKGSLSEEDLFRLVDENKLKQTDIENIDNILLGKQKVSNYFRARNQGSIAEMRAAANEIINDPNLKEYQDTAKSFLKLIEDTRNPMSIADRVQAISEVESLVKAGRLAEAQQIIDNSPKGTLKDTLISNFQKDIDLGEDILKGKVEQDELSKIIGRLRGIDPEKAEAFTKLNEIKSLQDVDELGQAPFGIKTKGAQPPLYDVKKLANDAGVADEAKIQEIPLNKIRATDYEEINDALISGKKLSVKEANDLVGRLDDPVVPGRKIISPIGVTQNSDGTFNLMSGNNRVAQALVNGEKTIKAASNDFRVGQSFDEYSISVAQGGSVKPGLYDTIQNLQKQKGKVVASDILEDKDFFKKYPQTKDVQITSWPFEGKYKDFRGYYDGKNNMVFLNSNIDNTQLQKTLKEELIHSTQSNRGKSAIAELSEARNYLKKWQDDGGKDSYNKAKTILNKYGVYDNPTTVKKLLDGDYEYFLDNPAFKEISNKFYKTNPAEIEAKNVAQGGIDDVKASIIGYRGRDPEFGDPMTPNKATGAIYMSESEDVAADYGKTAKLEFQPKKMAEFGSREELIDDYIKKTMPEKFDDWIKHADNFLGLQEEAFLDFIGKKPAKGALSNPFDDADQILIPYLKKQGYDSLKFSTQTLDQTEYVVFDPNKVKNITQNLDVKPLEEANMGIKLGEAPKDSIVRKLKELGYSGDEITELDAKTAKKLVDNEIPSFLRNAATADELGLSDSPKGFMNDPNAKQAVEEIDNADVIRTKAILAEDSNVFENLVRRWAGGKNVARTEGGDIGFAYKEALEDLPKDQKGFMEFMNHVEGVKKSTDPKIIEAANFWKQDTDIYYQALREQADRIGIDPGYVDDYATHIWKQDQKEVARVLERLSKSNPSFKGRHFNSYQEGIDAGLTPKYTEPERVMAEYVQRLYTTKNNLDLFEGLKKDNLIVEGSVGRATEGFEPINAPGFPRSTTSYQGNIIDSPYYAPSEVARKINRIFTPQNYSKKLKMAATAMQRFQNVSLSGGAPFTPINAFYAANLQKEMLAGNIKDPIGIFATASRPKARVEWAMENADLIKEAQQVGAVGRVGLEPDSLQSAKELFKNKQIGDAWDRVMADPTFKWGMPMLQIENYKHVKEQAIKQGVSETEAKEVAAEATRAFYGLADPYEQVTANVDMQNLKNLTLFAPYYRAAMVSFWKNNIKALRHPLALENRQNIKFIAGAALTYGAMDGLNRMLNGHPMSENPDYMKDKLLIPVGDKTVGIPFLSSIATVPRGAIRIGSSALKGDYQKAGADFFQTFAAMGIKPIGDILMNSDYFGRPIYDENALPKDKHIAMLKYLGKQALTHPYLKAGYDRFEKGGFDGTMDYLETISTAMELPFRFYDTERILNSPFWEKYNNAKDIRSTYNSLKDSDPVRAVSFYEENKDTIDQLPLMEKVKDDFYDKGDATALVEYMGGDVPQFEQSDDAPQGFLDKSLLYGASAFANPIQTIESVTNREPIRKLRVPEGSPLKIFDSSTVTERKLGLSDLDKGDTSTQIDHKIPKWIGGREKEENYQRLTNEEHELKTRFENNLRQEYESGNVSRKEALNMIKEFNAQLNPIEIEDEPTKIKDSVYRVISEESGKVIEKDLSKFNKIPTSDYQKAKLDDERFKEGISIFRDDRIPDEDKEKLYSLIGIEKSELEYYDIASDKVDTRMFYVTEKIDEISAITPDRKAMFDFLAENRRLVEGKMIASDGVLDELVEIGYINKQEASTLKKLKITEDGEVKIKVSGRGGGAKLKKAKFVPLDVGSPNMKLPQISIPDSSMPKIQNFNFSPNVGSMQVNIPQEPKFQVKFNL